MFNKTFLSILLFCGTIFCSTAQTSIKPNTQKKINSVSQDTLNNKSKDSKGSMTHEGVITDYLIIDLEGNTKFVDTSLTIEKHYKFNYLRKDNFGLLSFANIGNTYNQLTKNFQNSNLLPIFGARARHFNYMEVDDINYYEVPTPLTELLFKTAFQQGQLLDAFFTVNTSRQFNFSIAYKGLRSLGNYQNSLSSSGNLRFTTNFKTKNKRYTAKAHIVTQDLLNQENGGLKTEDLESFTSGDEDFLDRSVFDPNFENAENILVGKRFYLNHRYDITKSKDSLASTLSISNVINFEDKYFQFDQTSSSEEFFGSSFRDTNLRDRATLENFNTKFIMNYENSLLGDFGLGIIFNDINYGYDKITILNNELIRNRIKDQVLGFEGHYSNQIGDLSFNSHIGLNVLGDFDGSFFSGEANYKFNEDLVFGATININSSAANYNLLLNQSNYINYNWDNVDDFKNQNNFDLKFELNSKKFLKASVQFTSIDNYALFGSELAPDGIANIIQPLQIGETINLYKIKLDKEFKFGKFAIDNTVLYQNVSDESGSLNLPDFVVRNTFYYSSHFFKNKALFLQTGITFNYFTEYYMDGYDPLLAEFYSQTQTKLGGFPRLDFFINAKIRQTRIFLKAEHLNSSFTGYDYFSAPNNPYRDFAIRFGLVWNFFL